MNKIFPLVICAAAALAIILLSFACVAEDPTLGEVEFISYNGPSLEQAAVKCDGFGYTGDHHAACVRMVRADYCGDGTAWTKAGVEINFYDNLTPPLHTDSAHWTVDAAWSPAGALCIGETHRDYQPGEPECLEELYDSGCGLGWGDALIIDEIAP